MVAEIEYLGGLRTSSVHLKSNNLIITDAPLDNNGKGEAFSPTDLVSSALGSCMLTIMGILAEKEKIELKGTKLSVNKIMSSNPRKIAEIKIDIEVPPISITEEQKAKLINAAHTCPVALSLHPDVKQDITFKFK